LLEKILKQRRKERNKKGERNKQINEGGEREGGRVFQLVHPDTGIRTTVVVFKSSFWLKQMWD